MSKRTREASAKARIAAQREALRKQEQRRRATMVVTVAVIAVVAIAVGWWSIAQSASEKVTGNLAPISIQEDGSVVMAQRGVTAPVVDVYEDFQCPACKQFEETSGSTLKNLAAEGKAKVVYHVLTIFPDEPTKSNSLRAASAARCLTEGSQWMAFHDKLYQGQPSETAVGFTADQLVKWGHEAGASAPGFDSCVRGEKNVAAHQEYSSKIMSALKLPGTPTVMLDGQSLEDTAFVPSALREAVLNAAK
ncbi:DsbA family protein [Planotetraspora sp. GP83]|uniref:DsbA family protein n=1 Tax=Planotetraspora sp. GP83 TaxID=3156264 RepID=UPI003516F8F7